MLGWLLHIMPSTKSLILPEGTSIMYLGSHSSTDAPCRLEHVWWILYFAKQGPLRLLLSPLCSTLQEATLVCIPYTGHGQYRATSACDFEESSRMLRSASTYLRTLSLLLPNVLRHQSTAFRAGIGRLDLSDNRSLTSLHIALNGANTRDWTDGPAAVLARLPPTLDALRRVDIYTLLRPHEHLLQRPRRPHQEQLDHEITRLLRDHRDLVVTFHVRGHVQDAEPARGSITKRLRTSSPWLEAEAERLRFSHEFVADPATYV
ncbi:uncharacterized protein B0H18DRAFT_225925 [Fomitopsis serialis]|nr:uncharacterized protein B0H18DRAFT_225925 [Neoantrodia serialis]KAH9912941.1 hypothetical protein B0H18DRAFT_225925 [Neoantrodia serialis]